MKNLRKMATELLLLGLSCSSLNAVSQGQQKIDSLRAVLPGKVGIERASILCEISRCYGDVNNQMAYKYARLAYKSAEDAKDTAFIVKAGRLTSQTLRRLGKIDSAIVLFNHILPLSQHHNFSQETRRILNSLGVAYLSLAKYDKALIYFFQLLRECDLDNDDYWRTHVLSNIGLVYQKLEDYETALAYHYESLAFQRTHGDKLIKNLSYINISECLAFKKEFTECRTLVNKVFSSYGKNCPTTIQQSLYNLLGVAAFLEGRYDEAEKNFTQSYQLNTELKDGDLGLENLAYLVRINTYKSRLDKAESYLKSINNLIAAGVTYNQQILLAYLSIISMFENSGDFEKLAYYQKKYITLRDSVFDQRLTTNLMKIEAEHLERENKAKIESQNKILTLNEEIIARQKYLNIFIGIVAMLLVALATVLIRNNRQKQKLNGLLDRRVKERTRELQLNRDALHRACDERDILITKTAGRINSLLATIKGLCVLGLSDEEEPREYLKKVNTASDSIAEVLSKVSHDRVSAFNNLPSIENYQ